MGGGADVLPVRAVIFDMDGLMFDTERIAVESWGRAGQLLGVDIPAGLIIETVGMNRQDAKTILMRRLGDAFPYPEARRLRIQFAEETIARDGVPIKDGLYALLDVLEGAGVRKAVATSTDQARALKLLERAKVRNRFDAIVCGDEVAQGKPCPDIFLAAAGRLGCEAHHCMALEDSEAGLTAAHRAGMLPVMVPDLKTPSAQARSLAFRVFQSLNEVASFLSEELPPPPRKIFFRF
jgi:HAD superfamily hydrolase (TIGR01509 family)